MLDEVRVVGARAENNIPLRKKEEPPLPPPHREGRPRDEQEGTSASHGQGLIRAPPCWDLLTSGFQPLKVGSYTFLLSYQVLYGFLWQSWQTDTSIGPDIVRPLSILWKSRWMSHSYSDKQTAHSQTATKTQWREAILHHFPV